MSLTEQIQSAISKLRNSLSDVSGVLIASADGLPIAHDMQAGDPNRMAAMIATALGLGKRICETFGGGTLSETSVSGDQGQVYIYSVGPKGVLAVIAKSGANVGLIHLESRDTAKAIAGILN